MELSLVRAHLLIIFTSCLLLLGLNAHAQRFSMTESEYEAINAVTTEILERYPSDSHIYVGVGQSPAVVIALLSEYGAETYNVPFSDATSWLRQVRACKKGARCEALDKLNTAFDRFLPKPSSLKNKKIVFFDYVQQGRFANAMTLIRDYFESHNIAANQIIDLALMQDNRTTRALAKHIFPDRIMLEGKTDIAYDIFRISQYKPFSPYGSFYPDSPLPAEINPKYKTMAAGLRMWMFKSGHMTNTLACRYLMKTKPQQ